MSWFSRFSRSEPSEPAVATVRSVTFDTSGLRVESRSSDRMEWRTLWGEPIVATVTREPASPAPAILDIGELRAKYRADAMARGGGLVSADLVRAGGLPAVSVVTKHLDLPAYIYEGTLAVPIRNAWFALTRSLREQGTTGVREAVLTGHLLERGVIGLPAGPAGAGPRPLEGFSLDPYDPAYDDRALCSLCDDERFDELFPEHPLTKIRSWLHAVAGTMSIDESVRPDAVPDTSESRPESRLTARVPASAVGTLYLTARKLETAEEWLARSVPTTDGEPTAQDAETAQTLMLLGLARENQGKFVEADWALTRARQMFQVAFGDDDVRTVRAMSHQARVWLSLNRHEEASPLLEKALAVLEEEGKNSEVAVVLNDLGLVQVAAGQHARAIGLFEDALARFELAEREGGQPIPDRATVLMNLARARDAVGAHRQAADARARAKNVLQR